MLNSKVSSIMYQRDVTPSKKNDSGNKKSYLRQNRNSTKVVITQSSMNDKKMRKFLKKGQMHLN